MNKPTLLVLRTPDTEDDAKRLAEGLALLEPYRMGMSHLAERSVMEFIAERRYVGLPKESYPHTPHNSAIADPDSATGGIENRGFVAGLIAVGGIGLLMLISNKVKLSQELIVTSLALIASVSLAIIWPLISKRLKNKND